MPAALLPRPVKLFSRDGLVSGTLLVLVVWFGSFSQCSRFTLYSDDWLFFSRFARQPWTFGAWLDGLATYPGGRVGQWSLNFLLGAVADRFDSLQAAYLLLFVLSALAVVATWHTLTCRFSNTVALLAALVLALSPLISIRPFLNASALPVALLLLMVAGRLYVTGRVVPAYLVAILSIAFYELAFPMFALLPVLVRPMRDRKDLRRFLGHVAICVTLLAADAVLVSRTQGDRLAAGTEGQGAFEVATGLVGAAFRSLRSGLSGSVNLSSWIEKLHGQPAAEIWGLAAFAGFALLLYRLAAPAEPRAPEPRSVVAQTIIALLLMALAGYALVYFVSPEGAGGDFGRESRFHGAAALPLAILVALGLEALLRRARRGWLRHGVILLESVYLAALFAFAVSHQVDFVRAAERQRRVVAQLASDHPQMDPQASFIIRFADLDKRDRQAIEYNDGHSWFPLLRALFDFPGGEGPVIRIVHGTDWPHELEPGGDGRLVWKDFAHPAYLWYTELAEPEQIGHIWYYDLSLDGTLTARPEPIRIDGLDILHDGPDATEGTVALAALPRLPMFRRVMGSEAPLRQGSTLESGAVVPGPPAGDRRQASSGR